EGRVEVLQSSFPVRRRIHHFVDTMRKEAGIEFFYGPDTCYSIEVSVSETDGEFDRLDELIYVERHPSNLSTKFYGEVSQPMVKHAELVSSGRSLG
ncbi:unnamed protein product, partial [Musa hybrid cultivar]